MDTTSVPDMSPSPRMQRRTHTLVRSWRVIMYVLWLGILLGFAAIWAASTQIGLSTWWLLPRPGSLNLLIALLPFVPPAAVLLAVAAAVDRAWLVGCLASVAIALVAVFDLTRVTRFGIVECVLATSGLLGSIASSTGSTRPAGR